MTKRDIGGLMQMNSRLPIFGILTSGNVQLGPKVVVAVITTQMPRHFSVIGANMIWQRRWTYLHQTYVRSQAYVRSF